MKDRAVMRSIRRLLILIVFQHGLAGNTVSAQDVDLFQRFRAPFVEHLIEIDGGQLCCVERPGEGPSLMLIPGTFSDSRVFSRLVPYLDPSLRLLLVENRGLGRSWPPPVDGSIDLCARDDLLIANRLGVESFYVGGHSLGGMISIEMARVSPEKLRGVISIEGWSHWHGARDAFGGDMKSTLSESQLDELARYRQDTLQNWTEEQRSAFGRIWKNWDGEPTLRTTTLPVLELYGDRGRPQATREQLRIPDRENIQLRWFAGASHSLHYERPKLVAGAINQFIHQCEAQAAP
ncbi:MAG: alpha/beta hydrolase [Planctomycetaceae bacterium]|nr:alpha/beta hydrolase [Planctomycetaceae bacterium]